MKSNSQSKIINVAMLAAVFAASGYVPSTASTYNVSSFTGSNGFQNAFANGTYQESGEYTPSYLTSGDTILLQGDIQATTSIQQGVNNLIVNGNYNSYNSTNGSTLTVGSNRTLALQNIEFNTTLINNGETILTNFDGSSITNNNLLRTSGVTISDGINGANGTIDVLGAP